MYGTVIHPKYIQYKVHKDHYMDDCRWRSEQHMALRSRAIWGANNRALIIINVTEEEAAFVKFVRPEATIVEGVAAQRRYFIGN